MTNHVHPLLSAARKEAPGELMKALGQRYVQYFNRSYRRSGTLWEGRYRSCLSQAEGYLLACQRYIELNPVRAAMVDHPAEYRWSSYRSNAQGEADAMIAPHAVYLALGADTATRQAAYRELFRHELEPGLLTRSAGPRTAISRSAMRVSPGKSRRHWDGGCGRESRGGRAANARRNPGRCSTDPGAGRRRRRPTARMPCSVDGRPACRQASPGLEPRRVPA